MRPAEVHPGVRTLVAAGPGELEHLPEAARTLGDRVLLVTDPGIVAAGHVQRAERLLARAALSVTVFSDVHENPTTRDVDACLAAARAAQPNLLIALGGGSAIDTAKGCNFLLSFGGETREYRGWNKAPAASPMLPLIAIPTTAGTGSEAQSYALIADADTHEKMACGDRRACPRVAILDPLLTVTQPPHVTATAGMDALAHAVESAVAKNHCEISRQFSVRAFERIIHHLPRVWHEPGAVEHRAAMQWGAFEAGLAIENSMLGAAHALANPLTANLGLAHGVAVGMMLHHVVRFNAADRAAAEMYARLGGSVAALADALLQMLGVLHLPTRLTPPPGPELIEAMSHQAAGQWTANFNPRPLTEADAAALYRLVI